MPPPDRVKVPLVHDLYNLYKLFHEYLKLFPKQEKYSLGQKIENTLIETLELILRATHSPKYDKSKFLKEASSKIDLLKYLIRLAYETKSLNDKKYLALEEKAREIGRMLGGWIKQATN